MFEMSENIKKFLAEKGMNNVKVNFIDLFEDDLTGYEYAQPIIQKGYQLPITFIAKQPAFSGKVDNRQLYDILKRFG